MLYIYIFYMLRYTTYVYINHVCSTTVVARDDNTHRRAFLSFLPSFFPSFFPFFLLSCCSSNTRCMTNEAASGEDTLPQTTARDGWLAWAKTAR